MRLVSRLHLEAENLSLWTTALSAQQTLVCSAASVSFVPGMIDLYTYDKLEEFLSFDQTRPTSMHVERWTIDWAWLNFGAT